VIPRVVVPGGAVSPRGSDVGCSTILGGHHAGRDGWPCGVRRPRARLAAGVMPVLPKEFAIARLPHPSRRQPGEYPPHRAFVCRKARPGPQFRELLLLLGLALRLRLYKDLDRGNLLFQGRVGGVALQIVQ